MYGLDRLRAHVPRRKGNVSHPSLAAGPSFRRFLAGKFPEIRDCTSSHTQSGTLSLPLPFIPSGTSGKMERAPLQAARKVVTVLVVEDDWMIRENLVTDLQQEGWAVLEAATGAGALQSLQDAEKLDLLITDIGLADALSGWDVAEAFRIAHPEIPVIYASGNPANDHRRVAGSVFLSKPVTVSELTATCRKLLARPGHQ